MVCVLSNCCCCVELRAGSFVIAYLSLVWNIIVAIIFLLAIAGAALIGAAYATIVIGIELALTFLNLIFIITLLVGLHKYKRGAVKAYLIFTCLFALFALALFITNIVLGSSVLSIVINSIDLLFTLYFLLVIRSYYVKMEETKPTPAMMY